MGVREEHKAVYQVAENYLEAGRTGDIELMKKVDVADDMELTLWCHPKDRRGKPMKMGTVSKQGKTMIAISKDEWKNLKNVGMLTVHVEPKNSHNDKPSNEIVLQGKLNIIAKL